MFYILRRFCGLHPFILPGSGVNAFSLCLRFYSFGRGFFRFRGLPLRSGKLLVLRGSLHFFRTDTAFAAPDLISNFTVSGFCRFFLRQMSVPPVPVEPFLSPVFYHIDDCYAGQVVLFSQKKDLSVLFDMGKGLSCFLHAKIMTLYLDKSSKTRKKAYTIPAARFAANAALPITPPSSIRVPGWMVRRSQYPL